MSEVSTRSEDQERAAAEAEVKAFHDDLGPFVVAAEETRMAMVFTDALATGNPLIFANDSFLELTGYAREEVLGQPFDRFATRADEMLVLMMAEDCLEDMGCSNVSVAATEVQALDLIEANRFDAAMLDMNLNGDRTDALAIRGVPFMFATGYGTPGLREENRHRPVLTKPYLFSDMETMFERILPRSA